MNTKGGCIWLEAENQLMKLAIIKAYKTQMIAQRTQLKTTVQTRQPTATASMKRTISASNQGH